MGLSDLFIEPASLPEGGYGFVQLVFLLLVYGYILFLSSNLIADGSELLTLVLNPGLVGGLVLPVMGAVPDGAIVLFSGMGPAAKVQKQLKVGVGTLAGSTIMLLTIPWGLCGIMGRVDLKRNGKPNYKSKNKLTNGMSLTKTCVGASREIPRNAWLMIGTAVTYFVIQGPSFAYENDNDPSGKEKWWACAGFVMASVLFVAYSVYMVASANAAATQQRHIDEARKNAFKHKTLNFATYFKLELQKYQRKEGLLLDPNSTTIDGMRPVLRAMFNKWDLDGSDAIDLQEFRAALQEMQVPASQADAVALLRQIGGDDDKIQFDEFVLVMKEWMTSRDVGASVPAAKLSIQQANEAEQWVDNDSDIDDEEMHEGARDEEVEMDDEEEEEHTDLTPTQIKLKSLALMVSGVLVVTLFSDPMVDVLSELGDRINVSPFYVSFVVTPLVSNASEFLTSIAFARKRTKSSISVTFSALLGAATMNNTFCLALFLALVWLKELTWEFSAEVCAILLIELIVGVIAMRRVQKTVNSFIILAMFPLSIAVVVFLENVVGWD